MTDPASLATGARRQTLRERLASEIALLSALLATCQHELHAKPIGCPHCRRDQRLRLLLTEVADALRD